MKVKIRKKEPRSDIIILTDYKTGKIPEKQSYKQLLFYALGLFSKNPYL